jgi:benzodiazapine receptor
LRAGERARNSPSVNQNLIAALGICVVAVLLEGLCAGTGVKEYLSQLKWPSYSPPPWAWYAIAVVYYAVVFVCAYRILEHPTTTPFRNAAWTLLLVVALLNALWNVLFFQAKNLGATFIFSLAYSVVVIGCLYCLSRVDHLAAFALGLYAVYLLYANVWGYRVWRLNSRGG